jgi:predicted acyltransferase
MTKRLLSVDVFRGLTVMLMTIVNNPGDWGNVYAPFLHADWHGCTPTDLVFPFFLFIMGVAVPLSAPEPAYNEDVMGKILTRTFRIFSLGLFLSFFSKIQFFGLEGIPLLLIRLSVAAIVFALLLGNYDKKLQFYVSLGVLSTLFILALSDFASFQNIRIRGVLQRIALVYFFVSLLYFRTPLKVHVIIAIVLLIVYWLSMSYIPVGDWPIGSLEPGKNFAAWVDAKVLTGHMWASSKTWDPEGLFSTIPAIVTGILGILTGQILTKNTSTIQKATVLIIAGIVLLAIGWLWSAFFPLNKALWTSSFVLFTGGLGIVILSIFYFFIDHLNFKSWTKPFEIFGINPMLVFFASGIIPRALGMIHIGESNLQSFIYDNLIAANISNPKTASLTGSFIYLFIWFLILLFFYRRNRIFKV